MTDRYLLKYRSRHMGYCFLGQTEPTRGAQLWGLEGARRHGTPPPPQPSGSVVVGRGPAVYGPFIFPQESAPFFYQTVSSWKAELIPPHLFPGSEAKA